MDPQKVNKATASEAIDWLKTLSQRHKELKSLRDANSTKETRYYGSNAEQNKYIEPTYSVKELDKQLTRVAREIRLVQTALRASNAKVKIDYSVDENVLGEIAMAE